MYKSDFIYLLIGLAFWLSACAPAPTKTPRADSAALIPAPTPTAPATTLPKNQNEAVPIQSTPTETQPACSPARLEAGQVGKGLLDKPMDYYVLLPPCYDEQTGQTYPALYLLHGLNSDQEQWVRLGIEQVAAQLMQSGEIPPFLVILPFDHSFKQPGDYRFEEVFLEHLILEIDANYRSQPSRSARAVGGLSRGAAWAIYLATRNPDVFSIVGAHSPVVFYSSSGVLPLLLRDIPAEQRPTFYVDAGDKDIEFREIQQFTALLNNFGYPHEWRYNVGYHDEDYWSGHLEEYLRWYGSQFSKPNDD